MIFTKSSTNTEAWIEKYSHKPVILNEAHRAKLRSAAKQSAIYGVAGISALCGLSLALVVAVNGVQSFFKENELVFKSPVEMSVWTNRVLTVNKVEHKTILVENTKAVDSIVAKSENPTIAKKICDTFGVVECQTALAVAKAEGLSHPVDGWNNNENGSIDVGYFRINSIHFGEAGCSLNEVSTEDGNINCAYKLMKEQGWGIWSSVVNGSYLAHL